jgi:Holliday junction DNA helicase RuvA
MIASITGTIKAVTPNSVVIDVGGVGMLLQISPRLSATLMVGKSASLHTTLLVREDSLTLYGFESIEDLSVFEQLQTVTGIGPKVAQSALNLYEAHELIGAIASGNFSALEKVSGLGKKGAQRVILELKDKVGAVSASGSISMRSWRDDLNEALFSLGFNAKDCSDVIDAVAADFSDAANLSLEVLLRHALQIRGRR